MLEKQLDLVNARKTSVREAGFPQLTVKERQVEYTTATATLPLMSEAAGMLFIIHTTAGAGCTISPHGDDAGSVIYEDGVNGLAANIFVADANYIFFYCDGEFWYALEEELVT